MKTGTEILEIDDMNVIEYGSKYIKPYTASSTPQWLDYSPFNEFELTKGEGGKTIKVLFKNKDRKTFVYESDRNIKWDLNNSTAIFDYKILEENIGLLKINTFMGNDFIDQFDKIYGNYII